jgi:hypothetical protein
MFARTWTSRTDDGRSVVNQKTNGIKLKDVFGELKPDEVSTKWREVLTDTKEEHGDIAGFITGAAGSAVAEAVNGVLDNDLLELLARSVVTARDLLHYLDEKKFPPGKAADYRLLKQTLKAPQDIDISVLFAGIPGVIKVVLQVDLNVVIESLILTIQDGRVTAVDFGTAKVQTGLRYGSVNLMGPKETPALHLGRYEWPAGEGFPLA